MVPSGVPQRAGFHWQLTNFRWSQPLYVTMANFTFVENDTGPRPTRVTSGAEQTVQPFQFITRALQEIYYKKFADLENDAGPNLSGSPRQPKRQCNLSSILEKPDYLLTLLIRRNGRRSKAWYGPVRARASSNARVSKVNKLLNGIVSYPLLWKSFKKWQASVRVAGISKRSCC